MKLCGYNIVSLTVIYSLLFYISSEPNRTATSKSHESPNLFPNTQLFSRRLDLFLQLLPKEAWDQFIKFIKFLI